MGWSFIAGLGGLSAGHDTHRDEEPA